MNACASKTEKSGDACRDFNLFVMGQDYQIRDLTVDVKSSDGKKAQVRADLKNFGKRVLVEFDLVRSRGRWVIDEMRSKGDSCVTLTGALGGAPGKC